MLQRNEQNRIQELKEYLDEVGIKTAKLAELSDIKPQHLSKALCGTYDPNAGGPTTLSRENLIRLQFGLEQMAYGLRHSFITYIQEEEILKNNGKRFCPVCVSIIKERLRSYFPIIPFMQTVTGWNYSKARNVMDVTTSSSYGNISREDCDHINIRLAEIADNLERFIPL